MNMTKAVLAVLLTLAFSLTHAAEEVTYYHSNLVGSPIAATDDTGALLWEQSYDPWGAPMLPPSDSRSFTGAPADEATELVDMQARWYSPHVGRMLALDPAGFREDSVHSFNLYAYGNNNPYRYVDPNGETPVEVFTELMPAAGRAFAGLAAYTQGVMTGDAYLQQQALVGMQQQSRDGLFAIGAIVGPPGASKALKGAGTVTKKVDGPDFIVGSDGAAVVTSQSRMRRGFKDAGFDSKDINNGVGHIVPTPKGNVQVRTMEGGVRNARDGTVSTRRAVINTPGTRSPRLPGGGTPQGTKQQRRDASHFDQTL